MSTRRARRSRSTATWRGATAGDRRRRRPSLSSVSPALRSAAYRWAVARTSYLYAPGDMRRAYRWTRDALVGLAAVAALVLAGRLVLTTLFVTRVAADPTLVAAFNLGLTATATSTVVGVALGRRRLRRWWRHRCPRAASPPPARL